MGSIHIPSVDMTLPILKGVGESSLVAGAGTMKPTQQMGTGNYALASHYIEGKSILFGPLHHLQEDDAIFVTDLDYMYEYKTTLLEVIEATNIQVIADVANKTLLTLITCSDKGTKRLLVQAEFVEKTLATP
ncbi:MAG: class A sortase [Solibacillus sp.]